MYQTERSAKHKEMGAEYNEICTKYTFKNTSYLKRSTEYDTHKIQWLEPFYAVGTHQKDVMSRISSGLKKHVYYNSFQRHFSKYFYQQ